MPFKRLPLKMNVFVLKKTILPAVIKIWKGDLVHFI